MMNEYLHRRQEELRRFHPQWDFTNAEIEECNDLFKRDLTPICIPPSCDLIRKFTGTSYQSADGLNKDLYEKGEINYAGDQDAAEFLVVMRNLPIGGVLIGDINSRHILHGSQWLSAKDYYMLPNGIATSLIEFGHFQIDALYYRPRGKLFHIKVKKCTGQEHQREASGDAFKDMQKQRLALYNLLRNFLGNFNNPVQIINEMMNKITSVVYSNGVLHFEDGSSTENIQQYFIETVNASSNVLRSTRIRQFVMFLCAYRPNFFISPVQCAVTVGKNIYLHDVNMTNFYARRPDPIHNPAQRVQDFIDGMHDLPNTGINLGALNMIYLTENQMNAVGYSNNGEFVSKVDIIGGPPGSGKSIVLMLKVFILAQFHRGRTLKYSTFCNRHQRKLQAFVDMNRSAFFRVVKLQRNGERQCWDYDDTSDTVVDDAVDFELLSLRQLDILRKTNRYLSIVVTGLFGALMDFNTFAEQAGDAWPAGIRVVELGTILRSSKQIQKFLLRIENPSNLVILSEHNFDGIETEIYILETEKVLQVVQKRMQRLITIDGVNPTEIALYFNRSRISFLDTEIFENFMSLPAKNPDINFFSNLQATRSLEFPVMVLVNPERDHLLLLASRAVCHLIIFTSPRDIQNEGFPAEMIRPIDQLEIWQSAIDWTLSTNPEKVAAVFDRAFFITSPDISAKLKIAKLELEVKISSNAESFEKEYRRLAKIIPNRLEFHSAARQLYRQHYGTVPAREFLLETYENAINEFGTDNAAIWLDYAEFLLEQKPEAVSQLYQRAQIRLQNAQADEFTKRWTLLRLQKKTMP